MEQRTREIYEAALQLPEAEREILVELLIPKIDHGDPNEASAARAARLLLDRGYPWVRPLIGGVEAWSTAANTRETVASLSTNVDVQASRPASV